MHIHFKIRTSLTAGRTGDFTSQWFFDDVVSDQLYGSTAPYSAKGANRGTHNANDAIYRSGGDKRLLHVTETDAAYRTTFDIGVQI